MRFLEAEGFWSLWMQVPWASEGIWLFSLSPRFPFDALWSTAYLRQQSHLALLEPTSLKVLTQARVPRLISERGLPHESANANGVAGENLVVWLPREGHTRDLSLVKHFRRKKGDKKPG
jgi:hypothetical protein